MTPEEAANTPPLKKRRRMRTSPILEKITYTCHHAGSYSAKHSDKLPQNRLRLNTKRSVKCNCQARIVLTELQNGECRVTYFWKHEGHGQCARVGCVLLAHVTDPFADDELDSGRLPKVVDDWLVAQIKAGKDTDAIRKVLNISEEEKTEASFGFLLSLSIWLNDVPSTFELLQRIHRQCLPICLHHWLSR